MVAIFFFDGGRGQLYLGMAVAIYTWEVAVANYAWEMILATFTWWMTVAIYT